MKDNNEVTYTLAPNANRAPAPESLLADASLGTRVFGRRSSFTAADGPTPISEEQVEAFWRS